MSLCVFVAINIAIQVELAEATALAGSTNLHRQRCDICHDAASHRISKRQIHSLARAGHCSVNHCINHSQRG